VSSELARGSKKPQRLFKPRSDTFIAMETGAEENKKRN
jgi:hypothetical protein